MQKCACNKFSDKSILFIVMAEILERGPNVFFQRGEDITENN